MKWIISASAIMLFALCGRGVADESSKQAAAEELMKSMNIQGQMEKTVQYLKAMPMGQYGSTNLTEGLTQQREKIYSEIFNEKYWADVKREVAAIYTQIFTEEELKGAVDFYKSPAGQAFIIKQPEMMQRMMEFQKKKMAEIMPRIQEISRQTILNLQNKAKSPEGAANEPK